MEISFHLVLAKRGGQKVRAVRVTQKRPALYADEALVKVRLDLPDDIFEAPLVSVPVGRRQVAIGVEVEDA